MIQDIRHHDKWYNEMAEKESFFKYLSSETALTVLSNFTLKYTNTLDFNDPFDYNPAFTNQGLSKFMKRVGENNNIRIPRKLAIKNSKILTTDEFRREASSEFSVTCFSKSPHIVPMWAHYADCHRGCVLGFGQASLEELEKMFRSSEWLWNSVTDYLIPQDVKYTEKRPTLFNSEGLTNFRENGYDAYLIKAKAWEYEQEVRVIKMKPAGIYPFEVSQLRSVRFGLNIDPIIRKQIIKLVTSIKTTNKIKIRLFDVKLDHREFLLNDVRC